MDGNKWLHGMKIYGKETHESERFLQLCNVYIELAGQIRIIFIVS